VSGDAGAPGQPVDRPTAEPTPHDELVRDRRRLGGGNPQNPGPPTPGSDNDGPEAGYTPPEELWNQKGTDAVAAVTKVSVGRVYDPPVASAGARVLVDRIWPRGLRKDEAHLDEWLKAVAPSTELRTWYGHVPDRYDEFARRYHEELRAPEQAQAVRHLRELAEHGGVALLTASKAVEISQAAVLADLLRTPEPA
jgi:uncharacterized protein YeaO (DUF488 family)